MSSKIIYVAYGAACSQSVFCTVPVLHYLLFDHFDVFKALHTADVIHQDVGVGVADASAA